MYVSHTYDINWRKTGKQQQSFHTFKTISDNENPPRNHNGNLKGQRSNFKTTDEHEMQIPRKEMETANK